MELSCNDPRIEKYYIDLDYDPSAKNAKIVESTDIVNLTRNVKLKKKTFSKRLDMMIDEILRYKSYFLFVCSHPDVPLAIVDFIKHYKAYLSKSEDVKSERINKQEIWTIALTVLNFCPRQDVQSFLETYLIKNSSADNNLYAEYKKLLSHQIIEMILLEKADLYSVISCLKISDNTRNLSKIWVSHSLKYDFLSLKNQYFSNLCSEICIFESKQELLIPPTFYKINVTSIWSEDIAAAKELAAALDRNIVLINTLDFYDGKVIMPYTEIFKVSLHQHLELSEDQQIVNTITASLTEKKKTLTKKPADSEEDPVYHLMFYDGTWQKPVNNTYYWAYENTRRANATSDDISRCVASARKGFEIWSAWTTESRQQSLSKFAFALQNNDKPELSKIVSKWLLFPHCYQSIQLLQQKRNILQRVRKPKGIVTLMEAKDTNLFCKLTQSLIIGNSVIVICTAKSCDITDYCDMFSKCRIPSGVVNLLQCENVKSLSERYDASKLTEIYHQFTTTKQIVTMI